MFGITLHILASLLTNHLVVIILQLNSNNLLIFILFISSQRNIFKIVWPKYMKVIFTDVGFLTLNITDLNDNSWWIFVDGNGKIGYTQELQMRISSRLTIFTVFVFDCSLRFALVSTKSNCLGLISRKLNVDKEIVFPIIRTSTKLLALLDSQSLTSYILIWWCLKSNVLFCYSYSIFLFPSPH